MRSGVKNLLKYIIVAGVLYSLVMLILSGVFFLKGFKPIIYFPNGVTHNWGVVNEGELVKYSFVFENRGRKPLEVIRVIPTCSCTTSVPSKNIVQPGESSEINVSYTGKSVPIKQKEALEIVVVTNDPDKTYTKLVLECTVISEVFWYPNAISFYSKVGEGGFHKVQFISDHTESIEVKNIRASTQDISAVCEKNAKGIVCRIDLNPDSPKGKRTEKLIFDVQTDSSFREIEIPVYVMIK